MKKQTPENIVKAQIKDWLTIHKWFHFPILQGMGAYKGIADRYAIKNGVAIWIEIKAPKGKLSENQEVFRDNILAQDGHYIMVNSIEQLETYIKLLCTVTGKNLI